jgi:general secretion pathway protein D
VTRLLAVILAAAAALAPSIAHAQEPVPPQTEGIRLDFQDVDLRLVISALAEAGNLNVIYGELPQRSVTLRMSRPVAPDEVLGLLRSLAASNGLSVIEEGSLIRVVADTAPAEEAEPEEEAQEEEPLRLYVHRLSHVRAPRLAATLQSIFGGGAADVGARPRLQSLSERLREQRIPPADPDPDAPDVQVDFTTRTPSLPGEVLGVVQIVPDETTNSLIVRATASDWEVIQQAIQALDLRPMQVLIEVVIAEVRRTVDTQLGLSVLAENADLEGVDTRLELAGNTAGNFILEVMRFGSTDVNALMAALATSGNVRIVSRPVILAQNNQQARILIGAERPFIQVFRSLPTDAAVRDQVVQYRDVGTSLTLVPTINDDGYVNLDLVQEVNTATAEEQFGAPIISTREAATQLFVRDGQTVVIGGLIDRQRTESESGIPVLKDIPLLGYLFKSTSTEVTENELFMFLTPHIIATDQDADRLLEDLSRDAELLRPDTMNLSIAGDTLEVGPALDTLGVGTAPDTIGTGIDAVEPLRTDTIETGPGS